MSCLIDWKLIDEWSDTPPTTPGWYARAPKFSGKRHYEIVWLVPTKQGIRRRTGDRGGLREIVPGAHRWGPKIAEHQLA